MTTPQPAFVFQSDPPEPVTVRIVWSRRSMIYLAGTAYLPDGAEAWTDLGRKRVPTDYARDDDEDTYAEFRIIVGPSPDWEVPETQLFRLPEPLRVLEDQHIAIGEHFAGTFVRATVPRMPYFDRGIDRPYYNMESLACRITTAEADAIFRAEGQWTQADIDAYLARQDE